jgi:hypothetical protein
MSETLKMNAFDINPLVIEIENVIHKGLHEILANFMDRYELLENTHKQILRLPSIRQALNKSSYDSDSDCERLHHFKLKSKPIECVAVELLNSRLDTLEKKYDTIVPVLDKILNKINSLDQDVKSLTTHKHESLIQMEQVTDVRKSEKENIQIQFDEQSELPVEEEEESDDDDDNPALVTCSTIVLNKEKSVQEEVTVCQDEDDDELSVGEELGEHEEPVVEENSEEVEEADVEDNLEDESETKTDDNLAADVDAKSEATVEAVVDGDVEEEASIETETKSEVEEEEELEEVEEEEDDEDKEEELEPQEQEEPVKQVVEEKPPAEEEEDEELFEIEIDDKTYCTTDDQNGFIWELTEEGEQGEKIGYFENGDAYFYEDEN